MSKTAQILLNFEFHLEILNNHYSMDHFLLLLEFTNIFHLHAIKYSQRILETLRFWFLIIL